MKGGPINVLYLVDESSCCGAHEYVSTLAVHLNRSVFRPILVAPPALIEMMGPELPSDVETFPLIARHLYRPALTWRLWHLLRSKQVGILHLHLSQGSGFAASLGWMARVPVRVETAHARVGRGLGWEMASYFANLIAANLRTDLIAVSAADGRHLEVEKGIPANKIAVIRNGVGLDRFDPNHPGPAELRRSIRIAQNAPVVLVVGRLEAETRHRVLFQAWKAVSASFPAARLVCVGDGSLRNELEAMASEIGLGDCIRFVGYQRNLSDLLALADFTVLPSVEEGLPLVAIESLAAGRAVIVNSVNGITEAVLDGRTGLILPPGSPAPIAAGICQLLGSPDLARRMGGEGRKLVEDRFSQRRQVGETEALYLHSWRMRTGGNPWPEVSVPFAIENARRSRSKLADIKCLSHQSLGPPEAT
jgi:glycosyltransferase involved in cell wall biosynthesis